MRLEDRIASFQRDGLGHRIEVSLMREAAHEIGFLRQQFAREHRAAIPVAVSRDELDDCA